MWMNLLWAFLVGGLICAIAQVAMEITPFSISTAHVLVTVVTVGEVAGFFGIYRPLIDFAGMGASVPLCGFGNTMMEGVVTAIEKEGLFGILTGAFTAGAAGLCAAVVSGFVIAIFLHPKG
jgi:stage V sporulation protein AE